MVLILFQMYFMQLFIGQNHLNSKVFRFVKLFVYSIIVLIFLFSGLLFFDLIPKQFFQLILVTSLILNLLVIPIAIASIFERIQKREPIILFFAVVSVFKALVLLFYLANQLFRFTKFDSLQVVLYDFLFDLIVLSIGVIYFGFSKYREQNEQLLVTIHKNEQEQSKKIIEALEIERNRIAEDLYDDVGAMLSTAIGYQSNVLRKDDNKNKFPLLVESRKLLDKAVENLRTVSHNLMPKNFAEIGLSKSLKETINKVGKNSDITFTYFLVGQEIKLDASKEVQIFRIAVELINDILKNSGAKNATIQLIYGKNSLTLMAEDDGPGQPFHNNLTSKVDFINGKLDINFSPSGLTAVVEIPY
jgi:two-component system, sensor histidine kinase LadS